MKIAYLAAPYSRQNSKVKQLRHQIVTEVAFELMKQKIYVYSPLTHNVPISHFGIQGNWLTWLDYNHEMLSRCDSVLVLQLPGWDLSSGVKAEIACAEDLGRPIEYLEPSKDKMQRLMEAEEATFPTG